MPDLAVVGGVDTHKHTHHAAVLGADGTLIASQEFRATTDGHQELVAWLLSHGDISRRSVLKEPAASEHPSRDTWKLTRCE